MPAVAEPRGDLHPVGVLGQSHDLVAPADLDAQLAGPPLEVAFQVGLGAPGDRPAFDRRGADGEAGQPGEVEGRGGRPVQGTAASGGQETAPGQGLHGPRVQGPGLRLVDGAGVALQDDGADTAQAQFGGEQHADSTAADDRDTVVLCRGHERVLFP
nr:hypothetical protein [Streptomyces sp. C8S0]